MKSPSILAVLAFAVFAALTALAIEPDHEAAVVKLLEVSKVKDQTSTAINAAFDAQMEPALAQMTEEQQVKMKRAIVRIKALLNEAMAWEKLRPQLVELYAENFSKEEIDAIIPLMEKPEMQAFLTKQLELLPKTSAIGANATNGLQAQIQGIVSDEMSKPE